MTTFIEKIVGELGDKRRWRQYRSRVKALRWISKELDQSITAIERGIYKEIERVIDKERKRLVKAIERAEGVDGGNRS